ncbi:MAG: hypothetical protein ABR550_04830 [Wenzhouxiangellaceae bacterium]
MRKPRATRSGDLLLSVRSTHTAVELVTTSISWPGFDAYLPTRKLGQFRNPRAALDTRGRVDGLNFDP